MNELFLVAITLISVIIYGNDRAPALVYCLVAHVLNFIAGMTDSIPVSFMIGAFSDLLLIILLLCINGCLRSRMVYMLIPLSILSMIMHFYGWSLYHSGGDFEFFNSLVVFYMCTIIGLFASRAGRHGDNNRRDRFLRGDSGWSKALDVVSK